jgi:anti-sigma B factor antagonist
MHDIIFTNPITILSTEEFRMEIISTPYKRCDLVKITGRVDSFTAPKLGEALNEMAQAGKYNIILEMGDVEYVSSAGLRVMIDIQKTCKQQSKGEVLLVSVPKRIYETLELAGFVPLFRFFDNVTEAVEKF